LTSNDPHPLTEAELERQLDFGNLVMMETQERMDLLHMVELPGRKTRIGMPPIQIKFGLS